MENEQDEERSVFDSVPIEVTRIISRYLHPTDLISCLKVCKEWNKVASDHLLWMQHCKSLLEPIQYADCPVWNRIIFKFLKAYVDGRQLVQLSPFDCYWSLQLIRNKVQPPVWQDWCEWLWTDHVDGPEEQACLPSAAVCYNGSVNRILYHLFSICSLPWCQVMNLHYNRRKCFCAITSERDVFAPTAGLILKLGLGTFLKKVQQALNIPSLQWMTSAQHGQRRGNTSWLMESMLAILSCTEPLQSARGLPQASAGWRSRALKEDTTLCKAGVGNASFVQQSLFLPTVVIPVQRRCLMVLSSFIQACSHNDLHTVRVDNRVLIEAINHTLTTTDWFVSLRELEGIRSLLTTAAAKTLSQLTYSIPSAKEFQPALLNVKADAKTAAAQMKSRSVELMCSLCHLHVVEYMTKEGSVAAVHPIARKLQTYSQALTTPITTFCYSHYENRAKVSVLEHALEICYYLHQMKDFLSLKYILSAVRASISQGHTTNVSWKSISDKGCKRFKKFEDIVTAQRGYEKYLQTIQRLKEHYVAFLPAHQILVQKSSVYALRPQPQHWLQVCHATPCHAETMAASRYMEFLYTDISSQLRAGFETWDSLMILALRQIGQVHDMK